MNYDESIAKAKNGVYGSDVRSAIVDSLEAVKKLDKCTKRKLWIMAGRKKRK